MRFSSVKSRPWLRKRKTISPQSKRKKVDAADDDMDVDGDGIVDSDVENNELLDEDIADQEGWFGINIGILDNI